MYSRRTEKKHKTDSQKTKISRQNARPSNSNRHLLAAIADPGGATPADVLEMQKKLGNQTTVGVLGAEQPLSDRFNSAVQAAHGSGEKMSPSLREQAGRGLHFDFSSVRLHTGEQADALSRQIGAKAFTVGSDIFFTHGAFSPSSPDGQRILRHELTHVVQQKGQSAARLRLGARNNEHEQEAQRVSHGSSPASLGAAPAGSVQRTGQLGLDVPGEEDTVTSGDMAENPQGGSLNAVYRTSHGSGSGAAQGYFKPNSHGETAGSTMAARAVANSRMDRWLGLGAQSRERFADYSSENPGFTGSESAQVEGREVAEAGDHDYSNPLTQKGLSNLQLEDAITGQNDRHNHNIFVGSSGRVTGIDHDLSFSAGVNERVGGMNGPEAMHTVGTPLTGSQDKYRGLPSHVDAGAAQSILKHKAGDMGRVLNAPNRAQQLSPEEIQEAQARYKSVKRYVKAGVAGSSNAGDRLSGMGIDAGKAEKWKKKYANLGMPAPKIVDEWNQQTYKDQMTETGVITTTSRPKFTKRQSQFGSQEIERSYLKRIVQAHAPKFQGAAERGDRGHAWLLGGARHSVPAQAPKPVAAQPEVPAQKVHTEAPKHRARVLTPQQLLLLKAQYKQ